MRKKVTIIAVAILSIVISVIIFVNKSYGKKEENLQNIDVFLEENANKIEDKKEKVEEDEIVFIVGKDNIDRYDIEIEQRRIKQMSDEQKSDLAKSENAIIETTKKFVEKQEAIKSGIKIPEEKQYKFKKISEKMYENTDKTIQKDKYIEKWTKIQERDELADLYRARIIKQITLKELECPNKEIREAIDTFFEDPNSKNLSEAYNKYIIYLSKQYEIKY